MIRVVQTHTVGFEDPFLSRLGTLLPDPTILGKPDSDPAPDSLGIGLSPNSSQKYTVLYLELIRSLLDPFQGSHTIIGTSDSFRLPLTHSELPWLGLSLGMFHKVHGPVPWTNPCTIRSFSGVPHYYWDVGLL